MYLNFFNIYSLSRFFNYLRRRSTLKQSKSKSLFSFYDFKYLNSCYLTFMFLIKNNLLEKKCLLFSRTFFYALFYLN